MFTEETPRLVGGYFKLLDAVESHFKSRYAIERHSRQGELSLVFKTPAGAYILYAGLRWDLWSRMSLPLWIGVRPEWGAEAAEKFSLRHQGKAFLHEGCWISPLDPGIAEGTGNAAALIAVLDQELADAAAADEEPGCRT